MHEVKTEGTELSGMKGDSRHFKDAVLDRLSEMANIAQFVSFDPQLAQRFARVQGFDANHRFASVAEAVAALLRAAPDKAVNVRSFRPEDPKSRDFIYDLKTVEKVADELQRLSAMGLYTIVNERVDVHDGGVSGVTISNIIEFAPNDTPRCVEKPGVVSLPRELGLRLLEKVYHFRPALDYSPGLRIEFSIHPLRRGFRHDHTIVWELEEVGETQFNPEIKWPNLFSQFIGDKAFGLLIADMLELSVPSTTAIPRFLPPFTFGRPTGSGETWLRTCPTRQDPGHYTTCRGWIDPFRLVSDEDPQAQALASILSQEGVDAAYSGSLVAAPDGTITIEGVRGYGDEFMVGQMGKQELPPEVTEAVREVYEQASARLGPVRLEWVYDGRRVWVVQLHRGVTLTSGSIIYPGEAKHIHSFDVREGIAALRQLIAAVEGTGDGISLIGNVGVTSHFGDLLRRARIPSRVEPA